MTTDDESVEGSLLEGRSHDRARLTERPLSLNEDERLERLWRQSKATIIDCEGCGSPVRKMLGAHRKRWCDACLAISTDVSALRHARKVLATYGLTDGVRALEKALADLRDLMRANRLV
ncbi:MAG TPA: hypothetical protein VGS01_07785 [Candidatus Limnocylindria bacterium]|jgi:hypothetical protein|nr:hypothetical protein [Candidatus Limnocylindria bacterium]